MKIIAPALVEGRDFRRLSVAEGKGTYRFKTLVPLVYKFSDIVISPPSRRVFLANDFVWARLSPKSLTITSGYAWNGSSPKKGIRVLGNDVWLGTPDFPETLPASLVHDLMFQFSSLMEMPFTLAQANDFYRQICDQFGFCLTGAYHGALKDFSGPYWGVRNGYLTAVEV